MRIHTLTLALVLAAAAALSRPATAEDNVIRLFDGENLDKWYTFLQESGRDNDPEGVFTVEDGLLRIAGEEWGCITTKDEYENYKLILEYKWGENTYGRRAENTRDSGVLVHSQGEDGGYSGIWMHSLEAQIIEGGTGDFIVVGDGSDDFQLTAPVRMDNGARVYDPEGEPLTINRGRIDWWGRDPGWVDELGFRGAQDVEAPLGEWNTYEIIADGDKLILYLNGVKMNEAWDCRPTKGRIQIQAEGAEIFFRRIDLIPLESEDEE